MKHYLGYLIALFLVIIAPFFVIYSLLLCADVVKQTIPSYSYNPFIFYYFDCYSFTFLALTYLLLTWIITKICTFKVNARVSGGVFAIFLILFLYYSYNTYYFYTDLYGWRKLVVEFMLFHYTIYVFMLFTVVRYFIKNKQKGIGNDNSEENERL